MFIKAFNSFLLATFINLLLYLATDAQNVITEKREVVFNGEHMEKNVLNCANLTGSVVFYTKSRESGKINGPLIKSDFFEVDGKVLKFTSLKDPIGLETLDYYCESIGKKDHILFQIEVKPYAESLIRSQSLTVGGFKDITCKILSGNYTGNDDIMKSKWQWYKNDVLLDLSTNSTSKISMTGTKHYSILRLKNVEDSDEGEYKCELVNQYGNSSDVTHVKINSAVTTLTPYFGTIAMVVVFVGVLFFFERRSPYGKA